MRCRHGACTIFCGNFRIWVIKMYVAVLCIVIARAGADRRKYKHFSFSVKKCCHTAKNCPLYDEGQSQGCCFHIFLKKIRKSGYQPTHICPLLGGWANERRWHAWSGFRTQTTPGAGCVQDWVQSAQRGNACKSKPAGQPVQLVHLFPNLFSIYLFVFFITLYPVFLLEYKPSAPAAPKCSNVRKIKALRVMITTPCAAP